MTDSIQTADLLAESMDLVLELCGLLPKSYGIEVRPVVETEGYEDDRDWA